MSEDNSEVSAELAATTDSGAAGDVVLLADASVPPTLEIHPSFRCQLACRYCHSFDAPHVYPWLADGARTLNLDEYENVLEQFRSAGGQRVVISGGGEPTVAKAFPGLVRACEERGYRPYLYTNGVRNRNQSESVMAAWLPSLSWVRFSAHSDAYTRWGASVVDGIRQALDLRTRLGLDLRISVALLPETWHDDALRRIVNLLAATAPDSIALRWVIPAQSGAMQAVGRASELLRDAGYPTDRVEMPTDPATLPIVPLKCVALSGAIVLDPVGGWRICCTRAHLDTSDFAYLGNMRSIRLLDALATGVGAMEMGGQVGCRICSVGEILLALQSPS